LPQKIISPFKKKSKNFFIHSLAFSQKKKKKKKKNLLFFSSFKEDTRTITKKKTTTTHFKRENFYSYTVLRAVFLSERSVL